MRVGFWRIKRTLNARVCETYRRAGLRRCRLGIERPRLRTVPMHKLDYQKAVIDKSVAVISKFWGKSPRGWFGPGLTQTFDT